MKGYYNLFFVPFLAKKQQQLQQQIYKQQNG